MARPAKPMYAPATAQELCADGALDYDGAAASCSLSKRAIEYAVDAGEIEVLYHGRKPLIPKRELVRWLGEKLNQSRAGRAQTKTRRG